MYPLVVGVQIGEIIGIVVLVISVLSWFVNVIQGNTADGVPRQPRPQPKPQQGRSEIEELLRGLTGEKRKPNPEQPEQQPPRPPKPTADRPRSKPNPALERPGFARQVKPARQTPRAAEAKLPPANLGSGVRTHQLGNRVDAAVQQDINKPVQHDLGNRIAAALPVQERAVHPLVKVLRDPNGIRQAILLNEILQRPKGLHR